jgi:5-methylcytosine-specific restriction enzyme subunit McrC
MKKSEIPIQNIYYLLAYAWDHFRSAEELNVNGAQCPDVHNLLAMLLGEGIRRLSTQGMDKGYRQFVEETPRLRGRVDLVTSYRRQTQLSGRMVCEFDELTADTLPNQILKATCRRLLLSTSQLSPDNRSRTRHCLDLLADISDVRLDRRSFHRIQLHRNNRHYRLLMHVCRLLHDLYLPNEESGHVRFRSILDSEVTMHRLFESFVRRFAERHCSQTKVLQMKIKWDGTWTEDVEKFLPMMRTDVTLICAEKRTILDCKFYREALTTHCGKQRLHTAHLYQLMAYLRNKSVESGWETVNGILLYPAVNHHLDLEFTLWGHKVAIRSIDLDQEWQDIHNRMLEILA